MQTDRLLTAREVAHRIGISTRTLWRRLATREAPPPVFRRRGRRTLWRASDVTAFIAALRPLG